MRPLLFEGRGSGFARRLFVVVVAVEVVVVTGVLLLMFRRRSRQAVWLCLTIYVVA